MKKSFMFVYFALIALPGLRVCAQAVNPPATFSSTVQANNPSVYLNFNDASSNFVDRVSGLSFSGSVASGAGAGPHCTNGSSSTTSLSCSVSSTSADALYVWVNTNASATVTSVTDSLGATAVLITNPAAGQYAYYFANVGAGTHTVTVNFSASASYPTITVVDVVNAATSSPVDVYTYNSQGSTTAVTGGPVTTTQAGDLLISSSTSGGGVETWTPGTPAFSLFTNATYNGQINGTWQAGSPGSYAFNATATTAYGWGTITVAIKPKPSSSVISIQQPGFDATNNANYSAGFPYNGYNLAPNNTLGSVEWSVPFSIVRHIDRFNWNRTGTLVLASKGDIGNASNTYWELYIQMTGLYSQLCFTRNSAGNAPTAGMPNAISQTLCTASNFDAMPNGMNYDIVYTEDATGIGGGANLYINGLLFATGNSTGVGFGAATLNATGGTGYASSTPFVGVGGGPNCHLSGNMLATSGVPNTNNGFTFSNNYGCTSVPAITFTFSVTSPMSLGNSCSAQLLTTATSASCTVSSVTAGSTLLVGSLPANTTGVTDTAGTPVLLAGTPGSQGPIYYEANATAGTHTFTFATAATSTSFYYPLVEEVKGAAASSPIDVAAYSSGSGTAVSVGPITTTAANELAVGFMQTVSLGGSGWYTPSSPFSLCYSPGNTDDCAAGQAGTAGSYTLTATQSANQPWMMQLVAVKPLITNYAATGTGVTLHYGLTGWMMNSPNPLMAPGAISGGVFNGIAGTNSAAPTTYDDELAIFPSVLSFTSISQLFYQTKFYQGIVNVAVKPVVIVDDDTFVDSDNELLLAMAIGAHKAGVITLAGVVAEDYTPAAIAAWRQMLDAAGLNDVPVTIPPVNPGSSGYASANVIAYNANTPLTLSAWGYSTPMYRSIFAKYPTRPIAVLMGGPVWGGYAAFTSSAADGISSLTGLQLIAQNGAVGGAVYAQGWLYDMSASGGTIVANNQTMPILWIGGTPMNGGPGALSTRTAKDPLWLWFNSIGNDTRQCYDCLTLEAAVSSYFTFGVSMTATGGTGYAASTPFTLSGTGTNANCRGSGYVTASGGVLNGVIFPWGASAVGTISGVGSGCVSTPTVTLTGSTGTGGTITATPWACGAYGVSGGVPTTFSTSTCANQYINFPTFNTDQSPVSGAMMTWLINSWVDPPMPSGSVN
jgi:hypothetical protein